MSLRAASASLASGSRLRSTLPRSFSVRYLVIGGGGGGGAGSRGAGGGAGALITGTATMTTGFAYPVAVGAGGATTTWNNVGTIANGTTGSPSQALIYTAIGGGGGAGGDGVGRDGGSGGGSFYSNRVSVVISSFSTGNVGGTGSLYGPSYYSGGGGGAGGVGGSGTSTLPGNGGAGLDSDITGSTVTYAGGGSGANGGGSTGGTTTGGGGVGNNAYQASPSGMAATVNTGGGGGAAGNGGSGVVILRFSSVYVATVSAGLTFTSTPVGTDTVLRITAGTGTVIFS